MQKCSIKLKIVLIMGAVYAALLTVLLTGISYAKYMEERMAYANFGAASFNSVILSAENSLSQMVKGNVKAFDVFDEALKLQITDYRPGMKYDGVDPTKDTSKKIEFSIANGVNPENASEATVQYQIALRTTGHLPLKYSLLGPDGKLYSTGAKFTITPDNEQIGTVWHEQRFYKTVDGELDEEAIFELPGGILGIDKYKLIVEWQAEAGENSTVRYMKEVELLQILVTVSSKNQLEKEGETIEPDYGSGVILLDAAKGDTFVHYVDYRAFEKENESAAYAYTLTIENGMGQEIKQNTEGTNYTVEIEVPWTPETKNFAYSVRQADGTKVNLTTESNQYRLYDELYNGDYYNTFHIVNDPIEEDVTKWSKPDSDMRLYKVYTFEGEKINNAVRSTHEYQLILSEGNTETLSAETKFEHKIKIRVIAEPTGSQLEPTVMAEGGGTDG